MKSLVSLKQVLEFSSEDLRKKWCKQLLFKIHILHTKFESAQCNVCFGNLKVDNNENLVLVNVSEKSNGKELISDVQFDAPELFNCKQKSKASDIWATGICIYYINCLKFPWETAVKSDLKFSLWAIEGIFPCSVNNTYSRIVKQMLCVDPQMRPSIKHLVQKTIDDKVDSNTFG